MAMTDMIGGRMYWKSRDVADGSAPALQWNVSVREALRTRWSGCCGDEDALGMDEIREAVVKGSIYRHTVFEEARQRIVDGVWDMVVEVIEHIVHGARTGLSK